MKENRGWGSFYRESGGSPVSVHLCPCGDDDLYFPMVIHFLFPQKHLPLPDDHMYTKHMSVAMEIAVDLDGMGRMNLDQWLDWDLEEASEDVSLTLRARAVQREADI